MRVHTAVIEVWDFQICQTKAQRVSSGWGDAFLGSSLECPCTPSPMYQVMKLLTVKNNE